MHRRSWEYEDGGDELATQENGSVFEKGLNPEGVVE